MSELERRLRDALHGAAEGPPAGLMEAVRRRHRRHQLRLGASLVAVLAAAAIAVPQLAGTFRGSGAGDNGPAPATGHSSRSAGPGLGGRRAAAPGTVLSGCASSNIGDLGRRWKAATAIHAGPLWVLPETVPGGSRVSARPGKDALRLYVAIVVLDGLRPGSAVVIRSVPAHSRDLRFLYSRHDSLSPGVRYTMRSGEAGVTFVSCARDQQAFPAPYTDYMGAYLVRGQRCVPAAVEVPGSPRPVRIRLGDCPRR